MEINMFKINSFVLFCCCIYIWIFKVILNGVVFFLIVSVRFVYAYGFWFCGNNEEFFLKFVYVDVF